MLMGFIKGLFAARFGRRGRFKDVYALYERGDLDRADRACRAIGDAPRPDIDFLQGMIAQKRGDLVRASVALSAAVHARPDEAPFRLKLAHVLFQLERYADALEHFEAFLAIDGVDASARAMAMRDAGRSCVKLDDTARGLEYFERCLAFDPDNAEVCQLMATALVGEGRQEEARAALLPVQRAGIPGTRLRRALFLPAVYDSAAEIDAVRARFERELDDIIEGDEPRITDPAAQVGAAAFHLAYHGRNNAALLAKLCRAMRSIYSAPAQCRAPKRTGGDPIRIGIVSTFFYAHSVGRTTSGLIRDLPRERFSVHVFAVSPPDDPMRRDIQAWADHYTVLPRDLAKITQAIQAAALDVLVFADVGMEPHMSALALSRLAPVQAVTWGHSETSGVDTIDYYLSADGVEVEGAQTHYTERLVRPRAFFLGGYARPDVARRMSRKELGLPTNARLYACPQSVFKLHPDIDAVFAALLERDERAEILLLEGRPGPIAQVRRRFARTLGASANRVRFLPRMTQEQFLSTLAAADVALDPLYFGGCNSSCEAMALGVPLVTLPGEHLYGRFTYGLYREMGIERCIARTTEEYVDIATMLARERDLRDEVSREIAARSEVVFDRKDITLAYADLLEGAVAERR